MLFLINKITRLKMDERVKNLKSSEDCKRFAKNAIRLGRPDLALEAERRAIELKSEVHNAKTSAEKEALQAIYAYEYLLTLKNGKKSRATRTWQMLKRHGIIESVNRVVARRGDSMGYKTLKEKGMGDLAFEMVVLRYPDVFSEEAIHRSKERISQESD